MNSNQPSTFDGMTQKIISSLSILLLLAATCPAQNPPGSTTIQSDSAITFTGEARPPDSTLTLWYRRPAQKWTEALPVGNGRLGAMVFGGVERERLQLNEDTLWAGGPYDPDNTNAFAALPEVRKLIFAGQYADAQKLAGEKMMARPLKQMPYETVGDLFLEFPTPATVKNYRRELNLDTAVAAVSYTVNGVTFKREVFSSPVDQVIVLRLTADKPGQISFTAGMNTPQMADMSMEVITNATDVEDATLALRGMNGKSGGIKGALKFQVRVRVLPAYDALVHGKMFTDANKISVANADSVTLLIAVATSYKNYHEGSGDPETLTKNQIAGAYHKWWCGNVADGIDPTLADHIAAHQKLFRRVALTLETADGRARKKLCLRQRPATGHAIFSVCPLSADLQFAPRRPARESSGPLE
jgi:alpha-L-fucosidase 2